MALLTDDQDIRETKFWMELGGDGDYYLHLMETDGQGFRKRISHRVAMSGGNAPHEVKMAVAILFKAMENAGINERP